MINWENIILQINYKFNSIHTSSTIEYSHPEYGKLTIMWSGNKSKLDLIFVDTCENCICLDKDNISLCDCDWLGFLESSSNWKRKTFTKKQIQRIYETKNKTSKVSSQTK